MIEYPTTKKVKTTYKMHGEEIVDNYAWLEDSEGLGVNSWTKAQNRASKSYFRSVKKKKYYEDKLRQTADSDSYTMYDPIGDKLFWFERKKDEQLGAAYWRHDLESAPTKLIDLEGIRDDNAVSLDYWSVSKDAKFVVYGISEKGTEIATLRVKEVETGKVLPDEIVGAQYSTVCWLHDSSGFYYTCPAKDKDLGDSEKRMHNKLYFHILGNDVKDDEVVLYDELSREDGVGGMCVTEDDDTLFYTVSDNWESNQLWKLDRASSDKKRLDKKRALYYPFIVDVYLHVFTTLEAPKNRVLRCELGAENIDEISSWEELLPESEKLLENCYFTKSKMFVHYVEDVVDVIYETDHDATKLIKIDLISYPMVGVSASIYRDDYFISVQNMHTPKTMYYYDSQGSRITARVAESIYNSSDFEEHVLWATSKDGTKIPMFLLCRKGHDLSKPTKAIVYGYGGFSTTVWPLFSDTWCSWVEQGNVYVSTNIRGGNEYGEDWHKSGVRECKQNSFDDFIACCEELVSQSVTTAANLGILGASNGGLLVGVVAMQRPELSKAVICGVPLLDMYKFPHYLIASRWKHEYGDPDKKEDFSYIKTWSPYHNVDLEAEYPSFYLFTAENDTRVHPFHARKMAALLQSAKTLNPVLLDIEQKTGHTGARSKDKFIESWSNKLAFFDKELSS